MPSEVITQRAINLRNFGGGLNNEADISNIAESELASIVNLELDSNGALVSRPPITEYDQLPNPTSPAEFLGYFSRSDGVNFLVIANDETYLFNPTGSTWTEIASFPASGCAQYQNRLYICARETRGGWWGEVTPGTGTYTYQSLSGGAKPMPFGDQIVIYKERLWIAGWGDSDERTKVYLSEQTDTVGGDINNWPPLNFFYVGRGDGQWITKLHPGTNDLTVMRNRSSYYFLYESDPSLGTLRRYEGDVGADNKFATATYQNFLYTLSNGGVFQLVGYQFYRRNDPNKLRFRTNVGVTPYTFDAALSVVGNRLVVWFQGSLYVMNLNTLVWSQWQTDTVAAIFRTAPRAEGYFGADVVWCLSASGETGVPALYRLVDEIGASNAEAMVCSIRTKAYDFETPDRFKTLFWWSMDALAAGDATGTAVPVVLAVVTVSEDDMSLVSTDTLDLGTEDYPLVVAPGVATDRTSPAPFPYRLSYRFIKKMRFRRIYFEASLETDGTTSTGPVHIFGLVAYVEIKQKVTKGVS